MLPSAVFQHSGTAPSIYTTPGKHQTPRNSSTLRFTYLLAVTILHQQRCCSCWATECITCHAADKPILSGRLFLKYSTKRMVRCKRNITYIQIRMAHCRNTPKFFFAKLNVLRLFQHQLISSIASRTAQMRPVTTDVGVSHVAWAVCLCVGHMVSCTNG